MISKINHQTQTEASSWMPSVKNLAWNAVAIGTILAVGALCYYTTFSGANDQETCNPEDEISLINSECVSATYIKALSKNIADICSETSPFQAMCNGNLGFARSEMPQVNSSVLEDYLSKKVSEGIAMAEEIVDPSSLIPAQSEMSPKSIAGMMEAWTLDIWDPCKDRILSAGGYVIDGHHRWAACTLLNRPMTILNIHESARTILSELSNFRGVFSLALGQSV